MNLFRGIKPLKTNFYDNKDMYIKYVSYKWDNCNKPKNYKTIVIGEQSFKVDMDNNNCKIVTIPYGIDINKVRIFLTQQDESIDIKNISDKDIIKMLDTDKINNSKYRRIYTDTIYNLCDCYI